MTEKFDDRTGVSPVFLHRLVAAESDIDELGHVSNIVYLRWIQDAATAQSEAVGWNFDRYKALGSVFVVRKHEITYYTSVMAGDAVTCRTWVDGWRGASSPRCTVIVRDKDEAKVAACTTLWALIDIESGRPRRLPQGMREDFAREPIQP